MVKHENNHTSNIIQNVFMNKPNSAYRHTYTNTHPYTYVTAINVSKKKEAITLKKHRRDIWKDL